MIPDPLASPPALFGRLCSPSRLVMLSFRSRRYPYIGGGVPHLSEALESAYGSLDSVTAKLVKVETEGLRRTTTRLPRSTIGTTRNLGGFDVKGEAADLEFGEACKGDEKVVIVIDDIVSAGSSIRASHRAASRAEVKLGAFWALAAGEKWKAGTGVMSAGESAA